MNNTTVVDQNGTATMSNYDKIVGGYALFVTVFGTVGNIMSFFVCCRKRLRRVPIFVFLVFKLVVDLVPLLGVNFGIFWSSLNGYNLGDVGLWSCRSIVFLNGVSTESSVYIMVSDRKVSSVQLFQQLI